MSNKGKKNIYTCPDGHGTSTIEIDIGVTPMIIKCRHKGCKHQATSAWYNVDQNLEPEYEWFRPDENSAVPKDLSEHIRMGGLLLRPRVHT